MNPPPAGFDADDSPFRPAPDVDIVVFPSTIDIDRCIRAAFVTGSQAARAGIAGAFTGDVSMAMLAAHGCRAVLCGHSERRHYHHETDADIAEQVHSALKAGLLPILCIGETAEERAAGVAEAIVERQLTSALDGVTQPVAVAYEPVWAIGTGTTATPNDIATMHIAIQRMLPTSIAEGTPLLYGGSVTPDNAAGLFACEHVDGALVGGASLQCESFERILNLLRASP